MASSGVKAVGQTFMTSMVISAFNVVTGVITARLLLPSGRGELAAVILWPAVIETLGLLGTSWVLARRAACSDRKSGLARLAVVSSLLLASLSVVIAFFLLPCLLPADKQHLINLSRLYLVFIPFCFLRSSLLALDHGRMRWWRYNLVRMSTVLPNVLILLAFWILKIHQLEWFVLAYIFSHLVAAIFVLSLHWQEIIHSPGKLIEFLRLVREGIPFFLYNVSRVLGEQLDKALVVSMLPITAVGYYAAAFAYASTLLALGGAIGVTSFAALAKDPDRRRQGQYLTQAFRLASLVYLVISIAVVLLAPLLIISLFGSAFAPAVEPAMVLTWASTMISLGSILNEGLRGLGNTYPGILSQFLGAGVLALAAWQLVPHYGIMGLALGAVLSGLCQLMVLISATAVLLQLRFSQFWGFRLGELRILYNRLLSFIPV